MKLSNFIENYLVALDYCERIVNDGSRSNFTEKYLPKKTGNPFTCERFPISVLKSSSVNLTSFGSLPDFCRDSLNANTIYVHPELIDYYPDYQIETTKEEVVPTSSSRTVKLLDRPYYLKLCYPGRIGRITRELDERHIYSSLEVTEKFVQIFEHKYATDKFAFMPEYGGMLYSDANNKIGVVIRQQEFIGKNADLVCTMIPGFSLFSNDRGNPKDESLLAQLLVKVKDRYNPNEYVLNQFCFPLVDIFFNCVMLEGIIPELHSQNVIFGFNEKWDVKSIIIRDLESHDKDITLMRKLGKKSELDSSPFKCIDESQYNYSIKHSFMFDHKLGEYLIQELINVVAKEGSDVFVGLCNEVRKYVLNNYGSFIEDNNFFPEDKKWYKFENVIIDRTQSKRPYLKLENPLFR